MKITKSQLQQIIQEELKATLEENQEEGLQRLVQEEFKLIFENDKPDPMAHILSKIGGQFDRALGYKPPESDKARAVRMARLEAERRKETGIAGTVECHTKEECTKITGNVKKYIKQFNVQPNEKIVFKPTYGQKDPVTGEEIMGSTVGSTTYTYAPTATKQP